MHCHLKSIDLITKIIVVFLGLVFIGIYAQHSVDYPGYVTYYKCSQDDYCVGFMNNVEASFVYGAKLFGLIFGYDGAELFLFFIAATSFLVKINVIKNSGDFWVPVFCYFSFQFFHHEMTQLRVGLGVAFLWVSIAKKKETGRFSILFSALSILSHYSMLIGVLLFVALSAMKSKLDNIAKLNLTIVIYVVAAIFGYCNVYFINLLPDISSFERVAVYVSAVGSEYYHVPQFSVQLVTTLLLSLVAFSLPRSDVTDVLHSMVISGVGIYLAFYWIPVVPLRMFEVLTSVIPIYFSLAFNRTNGRQAKLMVLFLCAVVSLNWHVRNNILSQDNEKVNSSLEELVK